MRELPLVFFTVLTQTAVGAWLILMISEATRPASWTTPVTVGGRQWPRWPLALLMAACVFDVAILISTSHLGQPVRAVNTLFRMGASPMSTEIALASLFCAAAGISALVMLFQIGPRWTGRTLAWLAVVAGIAFLTAIPQVYRISTVATWESNWTPAIMWLTSLVTGGALAALLGARRLGLVISLIGIVVSFCIRPAYLAWLMQANAELAPRQTTWFTAQLVLLAIAVCAGLWTLWRERRYSMVALNLVLVVVAELVGRIAFYNLWTLPMA
ncbi:DmsC/YnfH family molybdoenzyme membrane anchor subunit [Telmatospirillum sp.]|uniref:dimethyl sulfoxide reductase anchor subunit family protein n=1 Tax=Telmatospirillum sp. TaxID=2079197 RepID=UPI0028459DE8|nr:DmsC/YnfH family molybdoenzyme membrane anchor subunit [Telmatospirillum sp.]MDR3439066.1 dimethyl sulfoxide reductase anchor subunit [Telmatospirillum sp.]